MEYNTTAIILAAGQGKRMNFKNYNTNESIPIKKQFCNINGITILEYTLHPFLNVDAISEVILVVAKEDIKYCERIYGSLSKNKKVKVIVGGNTRQSSVYSGLNSINNASDIIIIHDGVRPFINKKLIIDCIEAANRTGAACVAVQVTDTIKIVKNKIIAETLDRSSLWAAQTPQAFRKNIFFQAYENAIKNNYIATDDATLVERIGYNVEIVPGSYENIKITTPNDILVANAIAQNYTLY